MQKLTCLIMFLLFLNAPAQCRITGADVIQVGERQVYQLEGEEGACAECVQWTYLDQRILLESDPGFRKLSVKGSLPGISVLYAEIKTDHGLFKCEKTIEVIAPTTPVIPADADCKLEMDSLAQKKLSAGLVEFSARVKGSGVSHLWSVHYRSGAVQKSSDVHPKFTYTPEDVIDRVEVKVSTENCFRILTKSYDVNFWHFF